MSKKPAFLNSYGVVSPLILVGVISVLVLFVILGNFPLKDRLFSNLFNQKSSQAAGVIDLELLPNAATVAVNQEFLVDVAIDAKTDQPSAMVLAVKFDPQYLQATAAEQGFFFTEDLDPTTPKIGNGTIQMTLGQKPNQYKTGNGVIATLSFKALQATVPTTAIQIDPAATQIAAIGKTGNQVGTITDSVVTASTTVVNKTAEFSITAPTSAAAGTTFNVPLRVKTTEDSNLFSARLNFNPAILEVVSIDTNGSFINAAQWVNNVFDNATGEISLIGGVPNPGYKNTVATTMATIAFRGKTGGSGDINFGANSAIYRNSDNVDILKTPVAGATVNITGGASPSPSASPSVAPSPSASPSVAPSPSASPSVAPSASPSVAPSPSASPSVAPSPSASPSVAPSPSASSGPVACSITGATWVTTANPVAQGKVVGLNVTGSAGCAGQTVSFEVFEDDAPTGDDKVQKQPPTTKFNSSNVATSNWLAEFQEDGLNGIGNPPEYKFIARLTSGASFWSTGAQLQVNPLGGGQVLSGDADNSGKVDERDLSILLTNWNKTLDFIDQLDLNEDKVVNAIDWSTMIQILKVTQVIK